MDKFKGFMVGVIAIVLLGICLCFLFDGWGTVQPGERGIYVKLGRVSGDALGEGFWFKSPLISKIYKYSIKQETQTNTTACFSSDLQQVSTTFTILFKIPENKVIEIYRGYKGDVATSLIYPRVEEVLKQVTAMHRADELIKSREIIKAKVIKQVRENIGNIIELSDLNITNMDLTDELEKSIELKVVEEQKALAKTYELQKAQKSAEITIVEATAEAQSVKIKGEALKASPEVIQLEIAKKWNGIPPLYVSTTNGGANILLPLQSERR
jgi:regulator of protease activity HflC (stomatin/prohibitin superfamily)